MNPQDLPGDLFATTWTEEDADAIIDADAAYFPNPLLPLLRKAARHIGALQDKIAQCDAGCNCACAFDDPGDVCTPHFEAGKRRYDGG